MALPIVMSPTSLAQFRRCAMQWYFRNIERIVMPPPVRMVLGQAAHSGIEHNYQQKLETREDEPEDVVLDAYSDAFDTEVKLVEKPDEPISKAKDQGAQLVRLYQREVAPKIQPTWVERQTQFRLISEHVEDCAHGDDCTCGVPFSVTLDLATEADEVRDTKTTARAPQPNSHLTQLALGAIGYETETGRPAKDIVADVLVRTKKPQYIEDRWGGPVDNHLKRVVAQQADVAMKMISQGLFPTNGADAMVPACGSCGYKPRCPLWKRVK